MATDVERLEVLIEAQTRSYENAMKKLQSQTAAALKGAENSTNSLNARLEKLSKTVEMTGKIFGIVFGARELVEFVKNGVEAGATIAEMAAKLGITTTAYQELTFVAGQAGASQDDVNAAFKGMIKVLGEAADGSKTAQDAFAKLGISFDTIRGQSPDQVFELILDRLSKIHDPLQRGAAELQIFGKSGLQLGEMAQLGARGLSALKQESHDTGYVLSESVIETAKEAADKLKLIGDLGSHAGVQIAADFKPAIDAVANLITSEGFQKGLDNTATSLASIVKTLVDHPELLSVLAGVAVGSRFGGLAGAAAGAVAGEMYYGANTTGQARVGHMVGGKLVWDDQNPLLIPAHGEGPFAGQVAAAASATANDAGGGWKPTPDADSQKAAYDRIAAALKLKTDALTQDDREQYIANEVAKLGIDTTDTYRKKVEALAGAAYDAAKATADWNLATGAIAQDIGDTFISIVDGSEKASDALRNLSKQMLDMLLQAELMGTGPLGLPSVARSGGRRYDSD
jgi:hypothetical protein